MIDRLFILKKRRWCLPFGNTLVTSYYLAATQKTKEITVHMGHCCVEKKIIMGLKVFMFTCLKEINWNYSLLSTFINEPKNFLNVFTLRVRKQSGQRSVNKTALKVVPKDEY